MSVYNGCYCVVSREFLRYAEDLNKLCSVCHYALKTCFRMPLVEDYVGSIFHKHYARCARDNTESNISEKTGGQLTS